MSPVPHWGLASGLLCPAGSQVFVQALHTCAGSSRVRTGAHRPSCTHMHGDYTRRLALSQPHSHLSRTTSSELVLGRTAPGQGWGRQRLLPRAGAEATLTHRRSCLRLPCPQPHTPRPPSACRPALGEGGVRPHAQVDTAGGGGPCPRARGWLSTPHTEPFGPQLAEIHGVPRGLYDGPVHEVMAPTKPGGGAQARASCPGKISMPPFRNLHQSGFSLSGEWSLGCSVSSGP